MPSHFARLAVLMSLSAAPVHALDGTNAVVFGTPGSPLTGWKSFELLSGNDALGSLAKEGFVWTSSKDDWDGLGAYRESAHTLRVFINHEAGSNGSFSRVDLDVENLKQWIAAGLGDNAFFNQVPAPGPVVTAVSRGWLTVGSGTDPIDNPCSGNVWLADTFGAGRGFADTLYLTGEETFDSTGNYWVMDVSTRTLYEAPDLGGGSWENACPIDTGRTDMIALFLAEDANAGSSGTAPARLYVGAKHPAGSFLERNGLSGGVVYYWDPLGSSTNGTMSGIFSAGAGTTISGTWVTAPTNAALFSKLEDCHVNVRPGSPGFGKEVVFACQGEGLFIVDFSQVDFAGFVAAPGSGLGAVRDSGVQVLYEAGDISGFSGMDNLVWSANGRLYVNEDDGEGDVWEVDVDSILEGFGNGDFTPDSTQVRTLFDADQSRISESSGLIDVSEALDYPPGTAFLANGQSSNLSGNQLALLVAPGALIGADTFNGVADGTLLAGQSRGTYWDWDNAAPIGHTGTASDWDAVFGTATVVGEALVTQGAAIKREYNGAAEADGAINQAGNIEQRVYHRVDVTTGPTLPDYFGISSYDFGAERIFFGKRFSQGFFGLDILGTTGGNSTLPVQPNTRYTLVTKLDYAGDVAAIYVNPDLAAPEGANTPALELPFTRTEWSTAVRLSSGSGGAVTWDNLVVATSWTSLSTASAPTLGLNPVVTTAVDEDNGAVDPHAGAGLSLREALRYAEPGAVVTMDPSLDGAVITLALGEIQVDKTVTLDATALDMRPTVDAGGTSRILYVAATGDLAVRGLALAGGSAIFGGGVANLGGLQLEGCEITGCAASGGGGISNNGVLAVVGSTVSGNTVLSDGGGIYNETGASATLTNTTISGNTSTSGSGGGIVNRGSMGLVHATVADNSASGPGGLQSQSSSSLTMENTLVAANTSSGGSAPDIQVHIAVVPVFNGMNLVGDLTGSGLSTGAGLMTGDANLAPLGLYGGSLETQPPRLASDAVDAGVAVTVLPADQRGAPRPSGTAPDIGAVEAQAAEVTTAVDEDGVFPGTGTSLREAVTYLAAGDGITFDPSLQGGTLDLSLGKLVLDRDLRIDGLTDRASVTIDAGGNSQIFEVTSTADVTLTGLTLTGGFGLLGGAVKNNGTLLVSRCTFTGNSASSSGGGISNDGQLTVHRSTFSGNDAIFGGGIRSDGGMTLWHVTVAGNQGSYGGGLDIWGPVTLRQSLIAGNTAVNDGPDARVVGGGVLALEGVNFLGDLAATGESAGPGLLTGDPMLSPLGLFGGPTPVRVPLSGSPVVDVVTSGSVLADGQRWVPLFLAADIGAVEAQPLTFTNDLDDDSPGSLRRVLDLAPPGAVVAPSSVLSAEVIALAGRQLEIDRDVTIDATSLPLGLTLDAGGLSRVAEILPGVQATLRGLVFTGGGNVNLGGGIWNRGSLTIERCSITGNAADSSGGGVNNGTGATLVMRNTTVHGNSAGFFSGGVRNDGTAVLEHLTITGNSASYGGGVENWETMSLDHVIIAGNSAPIVGPDVRAVDPVTLVNVNFVGDLRDSGISPGPTVLTGDPELTALADHGGGMPTRLPLPGSPVINVPGASLAIDQRGAARDASPDLGAVEFIRPDDAAFFTVIDSDGDGTTDAIELALGRDPFTADLTEAVGPVMTLDASGDRILNVPLDRNATTELTVVIDRSTDLKGWHEVYRLENNVTQTLAVGITSQLGATGVALTDAIPGDRAYFRLRILVPPPLFVLGF